MEPNQIPVSSIPPVESMPPVPPTVTPVIVPPQPTKTSYGALIAVVVVTAAIAAGAYFLFTDRVNELVEITESQQAAIASLDQQSESTEPEAIQSDLAAESPDEFDEELDRAFAAFEASFEVETTQ